MWDEADIAAAVAGDIPAGSVVNLGIGLPLAVADHLSPDQDVVLHSENGIFGTWRAAQDHEHDRDLVNAGKQSIVLDTGGAIVDQVDSFALVHAGYIDLAVLGAYQVSATGDLANWRRPWETIAGVGGAIDIATGARDVWVAMRAFTKEGRPKLVPQCDFPLTAKGVVSRIYTELGVFSRDVGGRFEVGVSAPGVLESDVSRFLGREV